MGGFRPWRWVQRNGALHLVLLYIDYYWSWSVFLHFFSLYFFLAVLSFIFFFFFFGVPAREETLSVCVTGTTLGPSHVNVSLRRPNTWETWASVCAMPCLFDCIHSRCLLKTGARKRKWVRTATDRFYWRRMLHKNNKVYLSCLKAFLTMSPFFVPCNVV